MQVASAFRPAGLGNEIAGDFYDVFALNRTDVLITLGDVCGKGPEAAAVTAIARYTIRAIAADVRHPSQILRRLNTALLEHDIGEGFCSAVAMRTVPIVGGIRLAICCAGHPYPVVVRADGAVERIGVAGGLLGLFDDVRLREETVQLRRGDMIVAFTDGIIEAARGCEQFGEARVGQVLAAGRSLSAAQAVDRLVGEVLEFGGGRARDDIAVVALRVAGDAHSTD